MGSREEQAAASLATVESLTLGAAAVPHRERASERFEGLIQRQLRRVPSRTPVSALTVRGIVAGIRNCVYQRLRAGTPERAAGGGRADRRLGPLLRPAAGEHAARGCGDGRPGRARVEAGPAGRAADARSAQALTQRERIVRAAARLGFENGYEALSIPAISAAAGVSNQTFYDHFPGKQEAFLAAFDLLAAERCASSPAPRPRGRGGAARRRSAAGLRALLDHTAADELFARLAFFELPMAGPAALDHADRTLGGFTSFLSPRARDEAEAVRR